MIMRTPEFVVIAVKFLRETRKKIFLHIYIFVVVIEELFSSLGNFTDYF